MEEFGGENAKLLRVPQVLPSAGLPATGRDFGFQQISLSEGLRSLFFLDV